MHGFASTEQLSQAEKLCNGVFYPSPNQQCTDYLAKLNMLWRNFDPYNVYKWCGKSGPDPNGGCFTDRIAAAAVARDSRMDAVNVPINGQTFIPCNDPSPQVLAVCILILAQ